MHELPVNTRGLLNGRRALIEPVAITVGLRGPSDIVRVLEATAVEAFIDVAGLRPGRYNLPVTVESSADIGVTQVEPPRVLVTLR